MERWSIIPWTSKHLRRCEGGRTLQKIAKTKHPTSGGRVPGGFSLGCRDVFCSKISGGSAITAKRNPT